MRRAELLHWVRSGVWAPSCTKSTDVGGIELGQSVRFVPGGKGFYRQVSTQVNYG